MALVKEKKKPSTENNTEPLNNQSNYSKKKRIRRRKRAGSTEKIPIAINRNLINKPDSATINRNQNQFTNEWLSMEEIEDAINSGYAVCVHYDKFRKNSNFLRAQMVWIDFDTWDLEKAKQDRLVKDHAAIIYTTPSHRMNGNGDRFRIGFKLEKPIESADDYRLIVKALLNHFTQADKNCSDPVRMFFGSAGGVL